MKTKNEYENLTEAIFLLKKRKKIERALLKEHLHDLHESLKPMNLIKGLFNSFTADGGAKNSIIDTIMGIASGYVSKKILVGGSHNIFKKALGFILQLGVQKAVVNNSDTIKNFTENIVKNIFSKKSKEELSN